MGVMKSLRESVWPTGKKNLGSPIYVEEDGPILGIVDDVFVDRATGKPLAFKVLASGQYIELPAEAVTETPGGYVYRSPWFAEADALVRKLEGHNLIMPELFFSTPATASSDKKMLDSAMDRSPALRKMVDEAKDLYKELNPRLDSMEVEKRKLVGQIADLTEGMANGRIDKDTYREGFVSLKRRLQVLEATIRRGETLRTRIEGIPFVRLSLNGSARHLHDNGSAAAPSNSGGHVPAVARTEDWKRVKKLRVLRSEKELRDKEEKLRRMETELQNVGLPVDMAVQALTADFSALVKAHQKGPEALRDELERRLKALKSEPAHAPKEPEPSLPEDLTLPKSTCPLCGEPLKGKEKECPACRADLTSLQKAKPNAGPPGKGEVFLKGGGATKTGVVLLALGAGLFLLRWLLH
ncbi:MAG: hypothetical protein M1143_00965 [Candidatus Thermoplasmatota archaeon]|jgi:rubrerythrin|nr:hypothetical protein [Candidatus Thermoplasmatota archaeon]